MSTELFYIYDSHCPWSYAATPLVMEIAQAFPKMKIHLWHSARYDGDESVSIEQINAVQHDSNMTFGESYIEKTQTPKDSTIIANLMTWAHYKTEQQALPLLKALQDAHFQQGRLLDTKDDIKDIVDTFKLSPPEKVYAIDKLSKDAEIVVHEILELQELINTSAIPALLLAIDNNLILLNHNLYLKNPKAIIEAVTMEIAAKQNG